MLRSIGRPKQSGESVESVLKKKKKGSKDLQKRKVLSLKWKSEGVMDDVSGESMEPVGEVRAKWTRERIRTCAL